MARAAARKNKAPGRQDFLASRGAGAAATAPARLNCFADRYKRNSAAKNLCLVAQIAANRFDSRCAVLLIMNALSS
jgi:hypothetical protein